MLVIETNNFIKISQNVSENSISDYNSAVEDLKSAWTKHHKKSPDFALSLMTSLKPGGILLQRWECLKDKAIEKGNVAILQAITDFLKEFKIKGDEAIQANPKVSYPYGSNNPLADMAASSQGASLAKFVQSVGLTSFADKIGET